MQDRLARSFQTLRRCLYRARAENKRIRVIRRGDSTIEVWDIQSLYRKIAH